MVDHEKLSEELEHAIDMAFEDVFASIVHEMDQLKAILRKKIDEAFDEND